MSRVNLPWVGLAAVLILAIFILTSLTPIIKKGEEADKIPVDASPPAQLISGFPEFPVTPGAQLEGSSREGQGTQVKYLAIWKVNGSVPQLMDWYITTLSDGAWEIEEFPFDPGALGQQMARVSVDEWRADITIREEYAGEPIKIKVVITPKGI